MRASILVTALALSAASHSLAAQTAPATLIGVASGDSVHLFVLAPPVPFDGFVVYGGATGSTLTRLTTEPVRPIRDVSLAVATIGADHDAVRRALGDDGDFAMLRHLDRDALTANLLGFVYPGVATVLGRSWTDAGRAPGTEMSYRVEFVDVDGREVHKNAAVQVRVANILSGIPTGARLEKRDLGAHLTWSFPQRTNANDLAIGYYVYRARGDSAAQRITTQPIVRNEREAPVFDDANLLVGATYRYTIRAVDVLLREGAPSAAVSVIAADLSPPAPAASLAFVDGNNRVSLSWPMAPEPDVAGYHVERALAHDKPFTRLTTRLVPVDAPTYVDTTAVGGTQYFFRVITVDSSGNQSVPSNLVSALPVDRTPPAPPRTVAASVVAGSRRIQVRWLASPSSDVIGYYVYRGVQRGRMSRITDKPVSALTFVDIGFDSTGLHPGGKYELSVTAVDAAFNESPEVMATFQVPDDEPPVPPTGFHAANVLGRRVDLSWSASLSLDVARFVVERAADGGSFIPSGSVAIKADRVLRDTAVAHGHAYVYRVIAVDSATNRSVPALDSVWFARATPPPAPRNASAHATAAGVEVMWERVLDAELKGYMVYRSEIPTGVFERVTTEPIVGQKWVDAGTTMTRYYLIRAVDVSRNESAASPVVRAAPR
jgi:fibronectin type 3 domain-containing protein